MTTNNFIFKGLSQINIKSKKKTSNIMLVLLCSMITIYTIAAFALQYFTGYEINDTLTVSFFAFWGGEAGFLACIKISKVIKGEEISENQDESAKA